MLVSKDRMSKVLLSLFKSRAQKKETQNFQEKDARLHLLIPTEKELQHFYEKILLVCQKENESLHKLL